MYALEFETEIKSEYIKIPDYKKFMHKHVKVVLTMEQEKTTETKYAFDDLTGKLEWKGDAVLTQRGLRDEW